MQFFSISKLVKATLNYNIAWNSYRSVLLLVHVQYQVCTSTIHFSITYFLLSQMPVNDHGQIKQISFSEMLTELSAMMVMLYSMLI